jgi:replicative DNA helicase
VVIDYLALIKIQSAARYDLAVGEVSKGLKTWLNPIKPRPRAEPAVARCRIQTQQAANELRYEKLGEIEADADLILMLYRDEVYNPESPAKGIAEINVTKQRNGELGTIYRRFYNGHFLPIDQEEARQRSTPQPKAHQRRYTREPGWP